MTSGEQAKMPLQAPILLTNVKPVGFGKGALQASTDILIGGDGKIAVVHNGIIENYAELREELRAHGYVFQSETDTEVIVNLLEMYYDGNFKRTVMKTIARLEGSIH